MSDFTSTTTASSAPPSGDDTTPPQDPVKSEDVGQGDENFVGVDAVYQNYADVSGKPFLAEGDSDEAKAERAAVEAQREAAEANASSAG